MKLSIRMFLCFFSLLSFAIQPQSIIINELYNSSATDEWIELLVVQDGLDIRNWSIRDFNGSGVAQTPLAFANNPLWSNLKKGTVIVIGRSENIFNEDLDPSDYTLTVKSNNSIYLSGTVFSIAGASDAVQIRNSCSGSHAWYFMGFC